MSTNSRKGPIVDPGLCRCCGAIKKCRLLNVEYEWLGEKEVYSEMFVDCFGLLVSYLLLPNFVFVMNYNHVPPQNCLNS